MSSRGITVLGGGQAYLQLACGLLIKGYHVKIVQNRTADRKRRSLSWNATRWNRISREAAKIYLDAIVAHGDRPFDESLMQATLDRYWNYAQFVVG